MLTLITVNLLDFHFKHLSLICGKQKGTGHVIKSAHSLEASYFRSGLGTVWLRCHEKFCAFESFSSFLLFHLKIQSTVTVELELWTLIFCENILKKDADRSLVIQLTDELQ